MDYMNKNDVVAFLKSLKDGQHFTVSFDKQSGGNRIMTGYLEGSLDKDVRENVVMKVPEGYRTFLIGRVVQISV